MTWFILKIKFMEFEWRSKECSKDPNKFFSFFCFCRFDCNFRTMSTGFLLHLKFSSSTIKSNFGSSFSKGNKSTIEILKAESSLKLKKWLRYWSLLNRIPFVPIVYYVPFSLLVWRSFVFYMRSFLHAVFLVCPCAYMSFASAVLLFVCSFLVHIRAVFAVRFLSQNPLVITLFQRHFLQPSLFKLN